MCDHQAPRHSAALSSLIYTTIKALALPAGNALHVKMERLSVEVGLIIWSVRELQRGQHTATVLASL